MSEVTDVAHPSKLAPHYINDTSIRVVEYMGRIMYLCHKKAVWGAAMQSVVGRGAMRFSVYSKDVTGHSFE
jgi:hypothetical protein